MPEQQIDRVPVIEVIITEELDFQSLPRLDARLAEALELHPARLVVDLAACPRMDAAAIGLPLDPNQHQAMLEIPSDKEAGTIVQEMQAGYMMKDRLLRPAMVGVAKKAE